MEARKVKGTMLLDMVRMIRGNKDRDWDKYLKPEDWEVINSMILASAWYPLEIYQRCGRACFQVLAQGKPELAQLRGKIRGKELFQNIYKNLLSVADPMQALKSFVSIYGRLFNFSTLSFEKAGDKHAVVRHDYDPDDPGNVPYCYTMMGHLEVLIEMTGGKDVKIVLTSKQWEKDPVTTFDIRWE
ncbi:MAG TPA: hypothetical protein VM658_06235 [bacterium]|nr:hypothetical protein [bacterium]